MNDYRESDSTTLKYSDIKADEMNVNNNEPLPLLLRAYDRGLLACNARDFAGSHRAIGVLRAALALDTEASRAFDSLFRWCERAIDRGDYDAAARCLAALRGAWKSASEYNEPSREKSARIQVSAQSLLLPS